MTAPQTSPTLLTLTIERGFAESAVEQLADLRGFCRVLAPHAVREFTVLWNLRAALAAMAAAAPRLPAMVSADRSPEVLQAIEQMGGDNRRIRALTTSYAQTLAAEGRTAPEIARAIVRWNVTPVDDDA